MKITALISELQNSKANVRKTSFKGLERTIDNKYIFFTQPYDKDKYDILLEVCPVTEDGKGGFKINDSISTPITINNSYRDFQRSGATYYPRTTIISNPKESEYMGYRFRLVDKKDAQEAYKNIDPRNKNNVFGSIETKKYLFDPGSRLKDDRFGEFTVVSNKMGVTPKSGSAIQVFYDSYTSGKNINSSEFIRNHFNKAGGRLEGILTNADLELDPYRFVMPNPYIGADSLSSHKYWGEDFFKVPSQYEFKKVITELFKLGKEYIADIASTSFSMQSPFFQDYLKNGDKSPYKNWFKINGDLKLGVFPDNILLTNSERVSPYDHIGFKIINPMGVKGYDKNKPSYIQFFDDRLASEEQQNDTKNLIASYENPRTEDHYDITTHQDSIQPVSFELDYRDKTVRERFSGYTHKMLTDTHPIYQNKFGNENNRIIDNLDNFFTFENYQIVRKGRAAGADFWDGNVDLIKANNSNPNVKKGNYEGHLQVRNYFFNAASFWEKFAQDAYISLIAGYYAKGDSKSLEEIAKIAQLNDIPAEKLENIYKKIKTESKLEESSKAPTKAKTAITQLIDDFRYESLDLSPQLKVVVTLPAFREAMNNPETKELLSEFIVGSLLKMDSAASRPIIEISKESSDMLSSEDNERVFAQNSAKRKMRDANNSMSDNVDAAKLTPYGEAVLELMAPTIIGYAVTKAMFPDGVVTIENEYNTLRNSNELKNACLYDAGVVSCGEAIKDAESLAKNITMNLGNKSLLQSKEYEFAHQLEESRINDYSVDGIKFAKEFIKQARAGLNWRFDAAKDIADLTATRNGLRTAEDSLDDMIDFCSTFIKNVREVNPAAYCVLELTDLWSLYNNMDVYRNEARNDLGKNATWDEVEDRAKKIRKVDWGKYINPDVAERMIYEKTGATTGTQYSRFFGLSNNLFSRNFEKGGITGDLANMGSLKYNMEEFLKSGPLLSVVFSQTFWDNHDKPRGLHGLAVDMGIFLSRFGINTQDTATNGDDVKRAKEAAKRVLGMEIQDNNAAYDAISSKAVAVGDMYRRNFEKVLSGDSEKLDIIYQAIKDLALGKFKNKTTPDFIRAEAFGQTSFEYTLPDIMEQAEFIAKKQGKQWFDEKQQKEVINKTFAQVLKPALGKMIAMTDFLNSITGTPFFYAGNNMGMTGYEYASKNVTQQNRNIVRREWIDPMSSEFKPEIRKYFNRFQASCALYKQHGLSAISGGIPVSLPQDNSHDLYALLKYDSKGSNVIQVFCNKGINADPYKEMTDKIYEVPHINVVDSNGSFCRIKDSEGKDAFLKRKVYDETKAKFVDEVDENGNPILYVTVDGKLRRADGKSIVLNDTVTTFYKPLINDGQKQLDIMKKYHTAG